LFRIMRNEFLNRVAAAKNTVEDVNGRYAAELVTNPDQEFHMRYNELLRGIEALSPDTREALLLTAAAGMSYAEAATLCGCAVGTIKSRVNRARSFLTDYVEGERQISRKSEYREAPERARVRRT